MRQIDNNRKEIVLRMAERMRYWVENNAPAMFLLGEAALLVDMFADDAAANLAEVVAWKDSKREKVSQ